MADSIFDKAYKHGYITYKQKVDAEKYKAETRVSDDRVLRETKVIPEESIVKLYSDVYKYPIGEIKETSDTSLMQRLNPKDMHRHFFFPIKKDDDIIIYTAVPANLVYAEDLIREILGFKVSFKYRIISLNKLNAYISKVFKDKAEPLANPEEAEETVLNKSTYEISKEDSSKVVNSVNNIFHEAIDNKISDVHFEPCADGLVVRFRKDGILYEHSKFSQADFGHVINRIKTMFDLDVTVNKTIQDGHCSMNLFGKKVDCRLSLIPAIHGENIAIRILDQNKTPLDISRIGFSEENEELFKKLIKRPQGMILLTGPTGSGKSTSLYSGIAKLNTKERCIITFEDPVEYKVPGIVQVQINHAMGVTFPQALKSGLRQDIDVALVGEIRDEETALIAFNAANTGHLVLSTLHANSAADSIISLIQKGVAPYMISQSLIAVINQRLVRRICEKCKEEYLLEEDSPYRKILGCGEHPMTMFRGKGCNECRGTGYDDVIAIQEFLVVNDEIHQLIDKGASTQQIERAAIKNGMKKIHTDGIEKAIKGITTLDEVKRWYPID